MRNVLFLTPLPGTRPWDQVNTEKRIVLNEFPKDWTPVLARQPPPRSRVDHGVVTSSCMPGIA